MAKKKFGVDQDLQGNKIINGGFEVFATLPTTYKGGQITYANKVYTWNGTKYTNNENYFAETGASDTAGRWTVNIPGITELYDGLQIKIVLKTSYDSTYNTLDINGLGQKLIWRVIGGRLTSHFGVNAVLNLTYYSGAGTYSTFTGGWVIDSAYYSDTVTTNNVSQFRPLAGELINAYKIGMLGLDDKFYPFTKEKSTGTTKTVQTVAFKLNSPIFWFYSGGQIALDSRMTSLCTMLYEGILLYTLNQTFPAYTDLYLVGIANVDNNTFILDNSSYTSWCTNTLPTTDNGKAYMYLGKTYSSGAYMHLFEWHPVYYFKDGALRILNTNYVAPNDILNKVKTVDGTGSGLDADLLDGKNASDFATSNHNHDTTYLGINAKASDSDKLDGKHASEFATSAQGTLAASALQAITKAMVEAVLTGVITSHQHNYTTSTDVQTLINTAIASVYKPKGNITNKTALLALTNIKQGDVYNAQSAFTLNGQNVKAGDNIVCLADAATSLETNWDNLGGNIDFVAALSQALVGFSATSGSITSSDTILSAINKLAYDKHIHSNKATLDNITAAFTTELKTSYDGAVTALNNISGTNTGDETTQTIGRLINEAAEKITPVNADMVGLMDSAAGNILKKLSWANIKATLKAYFDTLYSNLTFYRVKVGSTYITSASPSDTIEFAAGSNVTLTPDSTNKKITIAAAGGGGSTPYRIIGVNFAQWLSAIQGNAIHFFGTNGVQVTPSWGGSGGQDLQLNFSLDANNLIPFLGELPDTYDLWLSGIGVSFLTYGNTYFNVPNPICGTDVESQTIEGFLTHYNYGNQHSFTFHDVRTNIMYISSRYWDEDVEETIQKDWKRLLTCLDSTENSTEYVIGEEGVYDYVIDSNTTEINIDPNFDPKKDIINIDITAFKNIIVANIYFKIIFNPAVPGPVTVNITNGNPKPIKYTQFYVDPAYYSNTIFEIQYIIWNRNADWLYHNRIL